MDTNNIVLRMPFDEQAGSQIAYDYSQSRADGSLTTGASFVRGKNGNAISFDGALGACNVQQSALDIHNDFTIMGWVKSSTIETGSPKKFIWLLSYPGVENYDQIEFEASSDTWYHVALVRDGSNIRVYVNASLIQQVTIVTLSGVSLVQDYYGGNYGFGMLDDVICYNAALTQEDIIYALTPSQEQSYSIDGVDFKDFGVYVSGSDGILNRPQRKQPNVVQFDNYHGEMVNLHFNMLQPRNITLSCFIKADSKMEFIQRVNEFEHAFDGSGTHRLVIGVHPIKPLIYEVYMKDSIEIKKTWSNDLMVGTFTLKLVEPKPVKRVLKHIKISSETSVCSITMKSVKYLNIHWGDGSVSYDVCGSDTQQTITHTYATNGEYFPVITGNIEEIASFATNAIVVWNRI